jgi:hypothetical protein
MRKTFLLLLCITVVTSVFISGCVDQTPTATQYKNDIVTIEEYYVSNLMPYADSEVVIEFLVQNNGEEPIPRLKVRFFDHPGFEILSLSCMGMLTEPENGDTCIFDEENDFGEIVPFDIRKIDLRLGTPSNIEKPTTFTIRYYVEYDYSGFRKMDLPIIDGETIRTPSSKFSQSTSTYGPIKLEFKTPERGEHKEDGKVVKEYWGVKTQPFKVEMKMTDVASSGLKDNAPTINPGDMKLDLKNSLERAYSVSTMLHCDFCVGGEGNCPGADPEYMYLNKIVEVPGELRCNFQSDDFVEPELLATIWSDFSYTYRYTLTEQIEVQPLE